MATVVYEGPTDVETIEDVSIDHVESGNVWRIEVGEDADGETLHREIPQERIYYLQWDEDREQSFLRH